MIWIVLVPLVTVAIGLLLALLFDRMKRVDFAKTLIFLPTAISFVGASLIWAYVYNAPVYNQDGTPGTQTGLLSKIAISLGWKHPPNWILDSPLNTFLLMVILIWIQVGFAMVVLGAALKAIPEEIIEAARIDGATGVTLFRTVQIPMIRNTLVVVATTITIASLKIFDIVFTVTGGNYNTDVLADQMYNQLFVTNQTGRGSALAVILFLCVVPLVVYNVFQIRRERARDERSERPPVARATSTAPSSPGRAGEARRARPRDAPCAARSATRSPRWSSSSSPCCGRSRCSASS